MPEGHNLTMAAARASIACADLRAELLRAHEYGWVNRLDEHLIAVQRFLTWCHNERSKELAAQEAQMELGENRGPA